MIRSLVMLVIFGAVVIMGLMATGMLDQNQLLDIFAGEVEMGETTNKYTEADFINVFDVILGEMEVFDTSRTKFERTRSLGTCDAAFVVTKTQAIVKYEVKSSPDVFYVDMEKKEYYVSPNLGVSYHEANRQNRTSVEESNCIQTQDIKTKDIDRAKNIADRNFKKSIEKSEKWKDANARFILIRRELLDKLVDAGFEETPPEEEFLN